MHVSLSLYVLIMIPITSMDDVLFWSVLPAFIDQEVTVTVTVKSMMMIDPCYR